MDLNKDQTVEQQVYEHIKGQIMRLELKPGQMINDLEVAKSLGVSRTPVRDAFRQLEYAGLLCNQPRHGWEVSPLHLEDIREIFLIKEMLQGMLARQAAGCHDESLRAELGAVLHKMETSVDISGESWWGPTHVRFHELLYEMSEYPNGRTRDTLEMLNDQWRRVRRGLFTLEGYRIRELRDHLEIGHAILQNDSERAEQLTRAHLVRVRDELLHLLENLVFPFATHGV